MGGGVGGGEGDTQAGTITRKDSGFADTSAQPLLLRPMELADCHQPIYDHQERQAFCIRGECGRCGNCAYDGTDTRGTAIQVIEKGVNKRDCGQHLLSTPSTSTSLG